jgi:hypothetical protein
LELDELCEELDTIEQTITGILIKQGEETTE